MIGSPEILHRNKRPLKPGSKARKTNMKSAYFQLIYAQALGAARDAEHEYFVKHGEPMYCGFAWVYFPNARTPFVNWCKKNDTGSKHWDKGWQIWNPTGNGTQSMDIKEAGAHAFAKVLNGYGIVCCAESRAD